MKIEIGTITREGFIASYVFRFENGITMRVHEDLLWANKHEFDQIKNKLIAVVADFKANGVEIVGEEKLYTG